MTVAVALALGAFFLPQEAPLLWTTPAADTADLLYLEVTVASDREGNLLVFPEIGERFAAFHAIQLPLAPSTTAYTYTFPLPDSPIRALRLHLPPGGGTFRIERMRVFARRGDEVRRADFSRLVALQQVQQVNSLDGGIEIVTARSADDARLRIDFEVPLLATRAAVRNWERAAGSIAYLSTLLWLGLMAVAFGVDPALRARRAALRVAAFFALISVLFAVVGHRSFLREAVRVTMFQSAQQP